MIKAQNYSTWKDTAWALHMILQMMGKTKLALCYPEPEWNHTLLYATPDGYTTGLIPYGSKSFSVEMDIRTSMISLHSANGELTRFTLQDNKSVSSYFASYNYMLDSMGFEVDIDPTPQECADQTPFDKQAKRIEWDQKSALNYLYATQFARNAIRRFVAPFRGKKVQPAVFWGTYDMTGILFSGKEAPREGAGYVGRNAFDEQMMEFGFWPGDEKRDEPTFFVASYPMDEKDYNDSQVRPDEAVFNGDYKEFFLSLADVLKYDDPMEEMQKFFSDAYVAFAKDNWENLAWLEKPFDIHN